MPIESLLVQLLVLAFTGALWWIARRDLAARVPPLVPPADAPDTAELEQLCATLETLVTSLSRRLEAVERQLLALPPPAVPSSEPPAPRFEAVVPRFEPPSIAREEAEDEGRPLTDRAIQQWSREAQPMQTLRFDQSAIMPRGNREPMQPSEPVKPPEPVTPSEPAVEPRHEQVYALLAAGISDPVEIARQTGLGRGEVDLILTLRDRRAL